MPNTIITYNTLFYKTQWNIQADFILYIIWVIVLKYKLNIKNIGLYLILILVIFSFSILSISNVFKVAPCASSQEPKDKFIKYAEFNITYNALEEAMKLDINSQSKETKLNWIDMLAYLGTKYGGNFSKYKSSDLAKIADKLSNNENIDDITKDMKHYKYYHEVYSAVLGNFLGKYRVSKSQDSENSEFEEKYGLKVFSPIAKTFPYSHFDDFGASRSYGYKRPHLGHDMMAAIGTPVVAIESGTVEIMGWNQYGGWRIGIRSFDKKRYYYYAHLRQNRPYHIDLCEGKTVKAGDVIGYVGRTGYSPNENVNNITTSHLHVGMQLIFDESQKECDNEIWIDLYAITNLLEKNKSAVIRDNQTKEFYRQYAFEEIE